MIFVTDDDINLLIRADMLQHIIGNDTTLLTKAEGAAIKKMRSYLKSRYDVDFVFEQTGAERDELILLFCIDIMLYDLHSRINPRKIPELRRERYKEALNWLTMVQSGEICAELPISEDEDGEPTGTNRIIWGSNEKRENYF